MDAMVGYIGSPRPTPLQNIEKSLVAQGSQVLGFYFEGGLAVEVFASGEQPERDHQPFSDPEGETWFILDASPTPTSMGPGSRDLRLKLAEEYLARIKKGPEWFSGKVPASVSLLAWEAGKQRALALRTAVTSPSLYLLRFDNGVFLGSSARPLLQVGFAVEPSAAMVEEVLLSGSLPMGRTAIERLHRLEPNVAAIVETAEVGEVPLPESPSTVPPEGPVEAMSAVVKRDAVEGPPVALLAVGPPLVDASLCLAASNIFEGLTVVEPLLPGDSAMMEAPAEELGLNYMSKEFTPDQSLEEWVRHVPYLDEPAASGRGLAHLLGVRTMRNAKLYLSSMALPARLEGDRQRGLGRRLRHLLGHGRNAGGEGMATPGGLPSGSRAGYLVLQALARWEKLRFSFPLTDVSVGPESLAPDALREALRATGGDRSLVKLPLERPSDGFLNVVRQAVIPALQNQGAEAPRWLRQGRASELIEGGERGVKNNPLGPLFLHTLLAWTRSVGAEVE
jgi:hypothetical protein